MSAAGEMLEKFEMLPPEKQQEVLDFAEFLSTRYSQTRPLRSSRGLWAGQGINITDEDIQEARREMWGNFPREDIV